MTKYLISWLLFVPFLCFGQIDNSKTDSLMQQRKTVDSLLFVLQNMVKQMQDTSIKDEITIVLEENNRRIDSLNFIIEKICEQSKDKELCRSKDFINSNLTKIYEKLDVFTLSLKDKDDFTLFEWTNSDSILIFDLKNTIYNSRLNILTQKHNFNKDIQKRINNYLSTDDYEYDGKKTKWERQLFCCYFSVEVIKLHIKTKKRGIQRLEIQLLEYLIKNAS